MIVGFHYTKLSVERYQPLQGKVRANNNITIQNVKEQPLPAVQGSHKSVAFQFVFTVTYAPHIADIVISGDVYYAAEPKKIDELLSTWHSKKKVAPEVSLEVLNLVLQKCNIRALEMAQELNLPFHVPLPTVNFQRKTADTYIG